MPMARVTPALLALFSLAVRADRQSNSTEEFPQLTMTREWKPEMRRIRNEKKIEERAARFTLPMTARAFQCWHIVRERLVNGSGVFEERILRRFTNGHLDASALGNPLFRNAASKGGFGMAAIPATGEFQKLSNEIERPFMDDGYGIETSLKSAQAMADNSPSSTANETLIPTRATSILQS